MFTSGEGSLCLAINLRVSGISVYLHKNTKFNINEGKLKTHQNFIKLFLFFGEVLTLFSVYMICI